MVYNLGDVQCEIMDYDFYVNAFEHMVKPEYRGNAERFLLEALEREDYPCSLPGITVRVEEEQTRLGCSLGFVFENCTPEEGSLKERMHSVVFEFAYVCRC